MTSKNGYIYIYVIFIILFWFLFLFSCYQTRVFRIDENFKNKKKNKLLHKIKYKCKDHQEHAYSPEICCKMVNGNFTCDNTRNCKCKSRNTGYCETCYPPVKKKKMY
jgi:hypothetical protein